MDAQVIGHYIKENRIKLDLTQREIAENLHISSKTISKWECGRGIPDYDSAKQLCKIFNVSINELLCGGTSPEPEEAEEDNNSNGKKKTLSVLLHVCNLVLFLLLLVVVAEVFKVPDYSKVLLLIDFNTVILMLIFVNIVGIVSKTQRMFWSMVLRKTIKMRYVGYKEYWENSLKVRMVSIAIIAVGLFMIRFLWAFVFPSDNRITEVFNMILPLLYLVLFEGTYIIIGYASKICVQKPIVSIKNQIVFGLGVICFIVVVLLIKSVISPVKGYGEDELKVRVRKEADYYAVITDYTVPESNVSIEMPLIETTELVFDDETYQYGDGTTYCSETPKEISRIFGIHLNDCIKDECYFISGNKDVSDLILCPRVEYKDSIIKEYILVRIGQSGEIPAMDVTSKFYPITEPIYEKTEVNGKKLYYMSYSDVSIAYLHEDGFWREYYAVGKKEDLISFIREEME